MADSTQSEQLEKRAADVPESDPIAERSLSVPILVSSLLLVLSLVWALYDEVFGQRPWKDYQKQFVDGYSAILDNRIERAGRGEKEIKASAEYQELSQKIKDLEEQNGGEIKEVNSQITRVDQQISDITEPFQDARAWITAQGYQLEVSTSESAKSSHRRAIEEKRQEKISVSIHNDAGQVEDRQYTYVELEQLYNDLRDKKARLSTDLVKLTKPINEVRKAREDYVQEQLAGLTRPQLEGLLTKMDNFKYDIKQINIANGAVVDRCESCHLGVREPLPLTKTQMVNATDSDDGVAFVSHPNQELLKTHDPERFGCSTCHGGNGRGTTSVEKGHGRYKHWLWPLYYKENVQAGCNQCHVRDRVLANAAVLNHGKQLFQNRGCVGCHRYEAFDREADTLSNATQNIKQLEMEKNEYALARKELDSEDAAAKKRGEDRARRLVPNSRALTLQQIDAYVNQTISQYDTRIAEADLMTKQLMKDQKKVGPNLKEIKAKLSRDWIPVWLANPQAFRPGTKMPTFRLEDDEVKAISAFLWQSAIDYVKPETQAPGDANHGRELFKTRGCMACHSIDGEAIGLAPGKTGGDFAADLSRVGEKANYDYIVRWVHNPRQRLAPYSPSLGRDITPADYAARNQQFVFDDEHSKSPVDGRQLQIQNMTVMPNFRLSPEDARDIASFLVQQTKKGFTPQYEQAAFMDDTSLFNRGKELTQRYGCAGCHEIKGLENEQRIGTELTVEGSKPIERLDFALLQHDAVNGLDPYTEGDVERGKWYDHKGFFENKLMNPAIYDRGKEKAPADRLRMPHVYLTKDDVNALTTFLLGSVETALPESLRYQAVAHKKSVQDGWWVVQKYNCMGCHNVMVGQETVLMGLPMYQEGGGGGGDTQLSGAALLPPRLTTEGARVQPEWLLKFLKDPSLHQPKADGRGSPQNERAQNERGPTAQSQQQPNQQQRAAAQGGQTQIPNQNPGMTTSRAIPETDKSPPPLGQGAQAGGEGTAQSPYISRLAGEPGENDNGLRKYLQVRMPTFNLSPNEVQALVNFFMGASVQPLPYVQEPLEQVPPNEMQVARDLFTSKEGVCLKCHMTGDRVGDLKKSAPNLLVASQRLKPAWAKRWILEPKIIAPDTAMPSNLFKADPSRPGEDRRWVFNAETLPPSLANYNKDHLDLVVRYIFQIDASEQSRLGSGVSAAAAAPASAARAPAAAAPPKPSARLVRKTRGPAARAATGSGRAP